MSIKFDILSLVTEDKDRQARDDARHPNDSRLWFEIDPDVVYPATLAHLRSIREGTANGVELFESMEKADIGRRMMRDAKLLTDDDFELAETSRQDIALRDDIADLDKRAEVLELARHWFTRALRVATGAPIGIHILKGSGAWKL